jgi:hypothetical protein
MSVHENLIVQHHQQDTDYYCGAACAQMVLETIGAGLLDQDPLYADNHSHSTAEAGWASGPDGLAWTMNDRRPASFTNSFVLFALANEDNISRKIVWTIHHYQVAPIALVFGWAHWIVVRGYEASAAPTGSGDIGYTISSFDVNNPWPPCPSFYDPPGPPPPPAPPPHGGGDGCGSGGDRGIVNEHISYATWQSTYMTGVPSGHWNGLFLAVCDPEPPAYRVGEQRKPDRQRDGDLLASPREAAEFALRGLDEYGLRKREDWAKALEGTEPGEPLLVQRLDLPDTYYYIVPMQTNREDVSAAVSVDARYGMYNQAAALADRRRVLFPRLEPESALKLVVGRKFDLEDRKGMLLVRPESICLFPTLVWKPCRESLSPFWPFYMITAGGHRLYIRIDGRIFTRLHIEPGI